MGNKVKFVQRVHDEKGAKLLFKDTLGKIVYLDSSEDEGNVTNCVEIGTILPVWIMSEKQRFDFAKTMLGDIGVIDFINSIDTLTNFKLKNLKNKNPSIVRFIDSIHKYDTGYRTWSCGPCMVPDNLHNIILLLNSKEELTQLDIWMLDAINVLGYLHENFKDNNVNFVTKRSVEKMDNKFKTLDDLINDGMTESELLSLYSKKKNGKHNDAKKLYKLLVNINKTLVCDYGVRNYRYNIRPLNSEKGFELHGENEDGFKSFKVYPGDDEFDNITEVFSVTSIWSKS